MNPERDLERELSEAREYAAMQTESLRRAEALIKRHSANHAKAEHERAVWFAENSAAQATLGRVRELLSEWEHHHIFRGCGVAAIHLRCVLGDLPLAQPAPYVDRGCVACDHGYPASTCSSTCDCGAC